ncbi:hypothetical protein OOT00_02740 [Desulfobotulus sp. H1]|uniref:Uncharacterized protein n=1 Tax=Desulfobotulus pelophilus TaxID=2823377 RepID=A0ABT3N6V7_9BACT|nr:hypothetical protein [Desulfobotulus pelophilus]MCW7752896.1 hypothetical protein [Desulfobotulus pelophilus]
MDKAKKARIEAQLSRMIKENSKKNTSTHKAVDNAATQPASSGIHVIRRRKGNPEERIPVSA